METSSTFKKSSQVLISGEGWTNMAIYENNKTCQAKIELEKEAEMKLKVTENSRGKHIDDGETNFEV